MRITNVFIRFSLFLRIHYIIGICFNLNVSSITSINPLFRACPTNRLTVGIFLIGKVDEQGVIFEK